MTNLDTLDLLFDPFYGPVWYDISRGFPESAFAYRILLRELMMSGGIYGSDSYSELRLRVLLALPLEDGRSGDNNLITLEGFESVIVGRISWEPYDIFLTNMGLDTGHDYPANYEPYFLQGLMQTNVGQVALDRAKSEYITRRNIASDANADVLDYLLNTCSACTGP